MQQLVPLRFLNPICTHCAHMQESEDNNEPGGPSGMQDAGCPSLDELYNEVVQPHGPHMRTRQVMSNGRQRFISPAMLQKVGAHACAASWGGREAKRCTCVGEVAQARTNFWIVLLVLGR
eukprot:scaffold207059_cov26-Tisochrysis_lutea.AAC.1